MSEIVVENTNDENSVRSHNRDLSKNHDESSSLSKEEKHELQDYKKNVLESAETGIEPTKEYGFKNEIQYPRPQKGHRSTIRTRRQNAVCVRHAHKHYGIKEDPIMVLDDLNMTVPRGVIYGLLGASGCGKTTLLNCIVGRRNLTSGEVWVLGHKPGTAGCGVPGPRIGYMPQDTALYGEFTIKETLVYFGWVAGLSREKITERIDFLVNLLLLPSYDQPVKTLSGGQQRRVSLASALIHEPELLLLDEPTVGLDPVLRENIWGHLLKLTSDRKVTVIITTHYIDETRQANFIALMRGGYFLAEESPAGLLKRSGYQTLEEVFFKLAVIQNDENKKGAVRRGMNTVETHQDLEGAVANVDSAKGGVVNDTFVSEEDGVGRRTFGDNASLHSRRSSRRLSITSLTDLSKNVPVAYNLDPSVAYVEYVKFFDKNHMRALLWKNFLWMWRNIPIMLTVLALPVVQSALFCIAIGKNPSNLNVAIVNLEVNSTICEAFTCNSTKLSCNFLKYLEDEQFILDLYDTEENAMEAVDKGRAYASILMHHNYSEALSVRLTEWQEASEWDITASEIDVYSDNSNKAISLYLKGQLYQSFLKFLLAYFKTCQLDGSWIKMPVKVHAPIYGKLFPNFTDFVAPGLLITFTAVLALGLTAVAMLVEKNEGSLERSLIIGITAVELLTAHALSQFVVMVVQCIITMVSLFGIFDITVVGSMTIVVVLTIMSGFCGMCFGLCISCVCDTERTAFFAAMGSLVPMIVFGGIIWPIEAMHPYLQLFMPIFPFGLATESLRCVMQRGWNMLDTQVYVGFISMGGWTILFIALSVLILKFKKL